MIFSARATQLLRLLWGVALATVLFGLAPGGALALTPAQALAIASGDSEDRLAALDAAVGADDPTLAAYLKALLNDEVQLTAERAYIVHGEAILDAHTGAPAALAELPDDAEGVTNNNRMRNALRAALAGLQLFSADLAVRQRALAELEGQPDAAPRALIARAVAAERDADMLERLAVIQAAAGLSAPDASTRAAAATTLSASPRPATRALLLERLAEEEDAAVRSAIQTSLKTVENRLAWGERLGVLFSGISLGSILLLVALGLAITYGLMGVINMAHGELMMIGAYATYVVQNLFRQYLPGAFDAYVLVAIPVSFLVAAGVGALMERSVIRWLYGRPLETLLATWGISLILMQTVRTLFGAQNVGVENPGWLSGGVQALPNLVLPYNRLAILVFAAAVLIGVALLIGRTRLGLFVRGVTQNRRMASCVGVNTARVDTYAFALGAGIAGLAGCALSQVGNVGPDLGQGYIVDAFLVVVLGGVGQLAGTVYAALGLGLLGKLLEGWQGAVLAKIMVLLFIVAFIQKRPQGIFALKGRSAEA